MINLIKKLFKLYFSKYNQFFFVGSSDILPPPLEKDEEIELVKLCQLGDINARNKLINYKCPYALLQQHPVFLLLLQNI